MLSRFFKRCWGFALPLLALPPLCGGLLLAGYNPDLVQIISVLGTFLILMATLAYIVFLDSKKRWPGIGAFGRLSRVVTFYRD